ncbi:MAG: hypothetical protein IJI20_01990 [Firmicutes bacterium]|nr:hypothetical protein [Bacillota bacterium]
MTKEIGGYLELEHFHGQEYYPDFPKVNLGRTALVWLLRSVGCRKLFMPYYICDTVTDAVVKEGVEVMNYHLDEDLRPVFAAGAEPAKEDWLYLVNYYGQLSHEQIREYRAQYDNVIVDNAQAYYDPPAEGVHTIYTCRKFLGVSDGAYLATDAPLCPNREEDHSFEYMQHLLGRFEQDASAWYSRMLEIAEGFEHTPVRRMSALTENLLRAIDDEEVIRKRRENYLTLQELLPSDNPFTKRMPTAPFAYPYAHENGVELRRALAAQKIYVPTNWSVLLKTCPEDSLEYRWSADILPLPVDQRYGADDMKRIAEAIREFDRAR